MQLTYCDRCRTKIVFKEEAIFSITGNFPGVSFSKNTWDICPNCLPKVLEFLRPEF